MGNFSEYISDDQRQELQRIAEEQRAQQERTAKARHTERSVTDTIGQQRRRQFRPDDKRTRLTISDARKVLWNALCAELGDVVWLPEYERVAEWLTDTRGKGLLCMGDCGRGKTVITQRILPAIIHQRERLVVNCYTALDLNAFDATESKSRRLRYDEIRQWRIISIDDMGTEPQACIFGETHDFMAELADECERKQKLLILSTNLSREQIIDRYQLRTFDRLCALTTRVKFSGKSLRG